MNERKKGREGPCPAALPQLPPREERPAPARAHPANPAEQRRCHGRAPRRHARPTRPAARGRRAARKARSPGSKAAAVGEAAPCRPEAAGPFASGHATREPAALRVQGPALRQHPRVLSPLPPPRSTNRSFLVSVETPPGSLALCCDSSHPSAPCVLGVTSLPRLIPAPHHRQSGFSTEEFGFLSRAKGSWGRIFKQSVVYRFTF